MEYNKIVKALECFAIDKESDSTYCDGCAFETEDLCCENCSERLAYPCYHAPCMWSADACCNCPYDMDCHEHWLKYMLKEKENDENETLD